VRLEQLQLQIGTELYFLFERRRRLVEPLLQATIGHGTLLQCRLQFAVLLLKRGELLCQPVNLLLLLLLCLLLVLLCLLLLQLLLELLDLQRQIGRVLLRVLARLHLLGVQHLELVKLLEGVARHGRDLLQRGLGLLELGRRGLVRGSQALHLGTQLWHKLRLARDRVCLWGGPNAPWVTSQNGRTWQINKRTHAMKK